MILKGPSGAGKTVTVSLLSQILDYEISEWKNPVGSEYSSEAYRSMSAHFEEFMARSGSFDRLDLAGEVPVSAALPDGDVRARHSKGRIILLEEFPHVSLSTSSALRSFRSILLQYLASQDFSKAQEERIIPVVMVITESRSCAIGTSDDNFTAHKLLGSEILNHPCVSTIEFNPIAPTLLSKALDLVIQKEARHSGRRRVPGSSVLKELGQVGDVRSAIGTLEFLCLGGNEDEAWSGRVATRGKKGTTETSTTTLLERRNLQMVTQRESNLGLFHAVGKVVYNKRQDSSQSLPQPPDHMPEYRRKRVPQVSVEDLFGETGTDAETFIAALHENFVCSCEGISFMDSLNECLYTLSDSDNLGASGHTKGRQRTNYSSYSFQSTTSEALRQDEICFHLAVRGLLFALPDPVKRLTHPITRQGGVRHDGHKMFYPTSMRLARQIEDIDSLVEQWLDGMRHITLPLLQSHQTSYRGAESTEPERSKSASAVTGDPSTCSLSDYGEADQVRASLTCTKVELVLERLPYLAMIQAKKHSPLSGPSLDSITKFHTTGLRRDEDSEADEGDEEEPMASSKPPGGTKAKNTLGAAVAQGLQASEGKAEASSLGKEEMPKMYLSDDDIED